MRHFFGKLGFIHRRLWERDGFYRVALFFGPAPLAGIALAAIVWAGIGAMQNTPDQPPPWARVPEITNGSMDAPLAAIPAKPLPPLRADGSAIGYDPGWSITVNPLTVSPTMDVTVSATPITGFTVDEPTVTMARILAAGPKNQPVVAVSSGLLVIREAGTYGLFARFERPAGPPATCTVRLAVGGHRINTNVILNVVQHVAQDYPQGWFQLRPGLYKIEWAFGCWQGNDISDLGQISVMLVEPGGHTARPLRAGDIVR